MTTSNPSCDVCLNLHVTKSASVWCSECEEAICKDCEQRHRTQKATKHHKTIPIADYQELPVPITNIKLECEDHTQKLDFYCSFHSEPCCTRCVSEKHKDCRELKPLSEVVDGVKSSAAFSDLQERITDISQAIGKFIQEKLDNKSNLQIETAKIIAEVGHFRKAINKHLDKIQDELLDKVRANEGQHTDNIDSMIGKLSKMKNNVDEVANALEKTKEHASNFQTFLCVNKWNQEIENQEREVKSAHNEQSMANVDIRIQMNPILDKIEKDISEFGKLEVNYNPPAKVVLLKEKQGQQPLIPSTQSISKIKLSKLRSFDLPEGESRCLITGCDMFEDGRIIFVDCREANKRLLVTNNEGLFIKAIELMDNPLDVSIIDSNTVAVTLSTGNCISIVDINTTKILRTLPVKENCHGICFADGKLVVSLANKLLQFLDLSGNVLSTVSKMGFATYCSVTNNKIYYAAHDNDEVYCCDLNGSVKWKFSLKKNCFPRGITHDDFGNIFVACKTANKVIVIESNGKESRVLLTSDDGLNTPRVVHYNHKNDTLIVCYASNQCSLYKITN